MHLNEEQNERFSLLFRVLGSLIYTKPDDYKRTGIDLIFEIGSTQMTELDELLAKFKAQDWHQLSHCHDELFTGIGEMVVPPWGSVYLDKENVVFGNSTLHYRQFLQQINLEFDAPNNDPEDHMGLMLMVLSIILASDTLNRDEQLITLLNEHLLPWADAYFNHFLAVVDDEMYLALIAYTQQELHALQQLFNAQPVHKQIYFNAQS